VQLISARAKCPGDKATQRAIDRATDLAHGETTLDNSEPDRGARLNNSAVLAAQFSPGVASAMMIWPQLAADIIFAAVAHM
jgi:hypothetical protein